MDAGPGSVPGRGRVSAPGAPGTGPNGAGADTGTRDGPGDGPSAGAGTGVAARRADAQRRGSLRAAFGGLTTRGRSFLAAGLAAMVCAYALGQPDLLRIGLLLAGLPLVCVLVLYRTRHRVIASRRLSPARVPVGSDARVHLRIDNVARLQSGLLMLEDRVPYVLGSPPRFVLDRVEPGGEREVSYRVRSDLRGRYPLGPLQLRLTDPFGMCELVRSFRTFDTLTVVPGTEPLPPVRLSGESSGYGDGQQRATALAGEDDVIPRGYRHGDDLRRIHWRSTARHGQLMVRREEQPQRAHCTVLLDTRDAGRAGSGPGSPFEWAVSGAGSVCLHLLERGYTVRLLTGDGVMVPGGDGAGTGGGASGTAGMLLEALAAVEQSDDADGSGLRRAYEALRGAGTGGSGGSGGGGPEGLLVAFLGELDEEQAMTVGRMRQRTSRAVAFVSGSAVSAHSDTGAGFPAAVETPALRVLREAGWTALPAGPGGAGGPYGSLPALWQEADKATVKGLER